MKRIDRRIQNITRRHFNVFRGDVYGLHWLPEPGTMHRTHYITINHLVLIEQVRTGSRRVSVSVRALPVQKRTTGTPEYSDGVL